MPEPQTEMVYLTLEESGKLCQLLLLHANVAQTIEKLEKEETVSSFDHRLFRLYLKLAEANDKLMGKT